MPLHLIDELDRTRVDYYADRIRRGVRPLAVGLSVLDVRGPATWDPTVPYVEHWTLTTFVLDGHHKLQAAAESEAAARIQLFISHAESAPGVDDVVRELEASRS